MRNQGEERTDGVAGKGAWGEVCRWDAELCGPVDSEAKPLTHFSILSPLSITRWLERLFSGKLTPSLSG